MHGDLCSAELAEPLHDGEAESHPLTAIAPWIVELVELLKDFVLLTRGNAFAGVFDGEDHGPFGRGRVEFYGHYDAAVLRIFQGIIEQVARDSGDGERVTQSLHRFDIHSQLETLCKGTALEFGTHRTDHLVQRNHTALERVVACREPRQIQEPVQEAAE